MYIPKLTVHNVTFKKLFVKYVPGPLLLKLSAQAHHAFLSFNSVCKKSATRLIIVIITKTLHFTGSKYLILYKS